MGVEDTRSLRVAMRGLWLPVVVTLCCSTAAASPSVTATAYVEGNVLAIFYHELGHALIDILDLPVLGQEEDAADVLSVVLTDQMWEEDWAREVAAASAMGSLRFAQEVDPDEVVYWGVHGHDLQRHFNTVCLFFGANPDQRADFAESFDLPAERAEGCAEEYDLAAASWGVFLDEIATETPSDSLRFVVDPADSISILLADEVDALNEAFDLPVPVEVRLESCGEANAFYYSADQSITICHEFVEALQEQAERAGL